MKLQNILKTLFNLLRFWVQGRVKIYSSQDIRNSLLHKYLKRLPALNNKDIGININGTYIIFHYDEGMSICNKHFTISSELGLFDDRRGYCECIEVIQPHTEHDEQFQPSVIKENYFSLNK